MHTKRPLLPFFFFLLSTTLLSPTTATPLHKRTTINCNDPTTGLTPSCWLALNMTGCITTWARAAATPDTEAQIEKKKRATTASAAPTIQSCSDDQTWSACFLQQQAGAGSAADCSTVNSSSCKAPVLGNGSALAVQMYYGAYSIYAINTYITTLSNTISLLALSSPSTLLTAASANIIFNLTSSATQILPIDSALSTLLVASTNNTDLPPAPNSALLALLPFFPSELAYKFSTSAGALNALLQSRLKQVLMGVMEDVGEFLAAAGGGAFLTGGKGGSEWGLVRGLEGWLED